MIGVYHGVQRKQALWLCIVYIIQDIRCFIFFMFILTGLIEFSSPAPSVPSAPSLVQLVPSSTSERTALLGSICNFNKATLRRTVTTSASSLNESRLLPWMGHVSWSVHKCACIRNISQKFCMKALYSSVKSNFKHFCKRSKIIIIFFLFLAVWGC